MRVERMFRFEASHSLARHPGKCQRDHGHSWRVVVEVEGDVDDRTGFVVDFGDLKSWVQPLIDQWDHRNLNAFIKYPSSENVACHVAWYTRAAVLNVGKNYQRLRVRVSETETTWAEWDSKNERDRKRIEEFMGAEWYTPQVEMEAELPTLAYAESAVAVARYAYIKTLTMYEQVRLFTESMKPMPAEEKQFLVEAKHDAIKSGG